MIKLLVVVLLLAGCTSYLGDRLSLNFVQIKAKQQGEFCYYAGDENFDQFCMKFVPYIEP